MRDRPNKFSTKCFEWPILGCVPRNDLVLARTQRSCVPVAAWIVIHDEKRIDVIRKVIISTVFVRSDLCVFTQLYRKTTSDQIANTSTREHRFFRRFWLESEVGIPRHGWELLRFLIVAKSSIMSELQIGLLCC